MQLIAKQYYTPEEYLELEATANYKSEYIGRQIIAMAGASINHNRISLNLSSGLNFAFRNQNYEVFMGDMRLWIPQKLIYTYPDVIIIAAVIEWSLPFLPHPEQYGFKMLQAFIGTLMVGFASGIYLIANLGPGPRDGLMTGFQRVTGFPIAWVRASIEIVVVAIGWALGGSIGLATILFAFGIGPAVSVGLFCISAIVKK